MERENYYRQKPVDMGGVPLGKHQLIFGGRAPLGKNQLIFGGRVPLIKNQLIFGGYLL